MYYKDKSCCDELAELKTNLRIEITPIIVFCDLLITEKYGDLNDKQINRIQRISERVTKIIDIVSVNFKY